MTSVAEVKARTARLSDALGVRSPYHDFLDAQPRRSVRDAVGLGRLALRVAASPEHPPRLLAGDRVEIGPEVGRDRVVGDVAHHPRLLAVPDLPEAVAAELAVVALLIDRVAAAAVDQDPVLRVGDELVWRGRALPAGSTCTFGIRRNG